MRFKSSLIWLILCLVMLIGCTGNSNKIEQHDGHRPVDNEHNDESKRPNPTVPMPVQDRIAERIKQMTLREKIGQMIVAGVDGHKVTEQSRTLIDTYRVGGLILFKKNIANVEQTVQLLNAFKEENVNNSVISAPSIPLFLSVDQEGGRVARLPGLVDLPSSQTIGGAQDESLSFNVGEILGEQLDAFGLNMNNAPVLDIFSNPRNKVIGDRAYGTTAEIVQHHGVQVMKGMQSKDVIPVVKHFPGHGDTLEDSHFALPVVDKSVDELSELELVPFVEAINNGADVVMISHILMNEIDDEHPATLSKAVIADLLREQLGFTGVVVTDDMTMRAITNHYDIGEAAVLAVNAGNDLIMVAHGYDNVVHTIETIEQGVKSGVILEATIDQSVYRLLHLKYQYNLTNDMIDHIDLDSINVKTENLIEELELNLQL